MLTLLCDPQLAPHAAAKAVRGGADPLSPLALHHLPPAWEAATIPAPAVPQGSRAPVLSKFFSFPNESCCFTCWELAFAFLFFFFFPLKQRPAQLSARREPAFSFHMSECFCFWGNLSELCFFFYLKYLVLLLSL